MLKRKFHIALSIWLAILLLFGSTPKDFIHLFTGHKDTVDAPFHKGLVLESQHKHCAFTGLELASFANDIVLPKLFLRFVSFTNRNTVFEAFCLFRPTVSLKLRGPPIQQKTTIV